MNIEKNINLAPLTTMQVGGEADFFTKVSSLDELREAISYARKSDLDLFILGGGSNILFSDEGFSGLVVKNNIKGFEVVDETNEHTVITLGSGEGWDETVERSVNMNLSGIEALSLIPGTVGAAPIQNIGAYGQEIKDTLKHVTVYDRNTEEIKELANNECKFSYRNSIFKEHPNRYIIVSVTLRLSKTHMTPPFYDSLERELKRRNISDYTPQNIRESIIAVRQRILPDPERTPNSGSFFKSPIISREKAHDFRLHNPNAPLYDTDEGVKIPAGWLVEQAGLKNWCKYGFCTSEKHALVIINRGGNFTDLRRFKEEIIRSVERQFGFILEQEPQTVR